MDQHLQNYYSICSLIGITTHKSVADKFPIANSISFDNWRFFVTTLSFILLTDVIKRLRLTEEEQHKVIWENFDKLASEYSDFPDDLTKFIAASDSSPEELGFWLASNLFSKSSSTLSKEEFDVGFVTTHLAMSHAASFIE